MLRRFSTKITLILLLLFPLILKVNAQIDTLRNAASRGRTIFNNFFGHPTSTTSSGTFGTTQVQQKQVSTTPAPVTSRQQLPATSRPSFPSFSPSTTNDGNRGTTNPLPLPQQTAPSSWIPTTPLRQSPSSVPQPSKPVTIQPIPAPHGQTQWSGNRSPDPSQPSVFTTAPPSQLTASSSKNWIPTGGRQQADGTGGWKIPSSGSQKNELDSPSGQRAPQHLHQQQPGQQQQTGITSVGGESSFQTLRSPSHSALGANNRGSTAVSLSAPSQPIPSPSNWNAHSSKAVVQVGPSQLTPPSPLQGMTGEADSPRTLFPAKSANISPPNTQSTLGGRPLASTAGGGGGGRQREFGADSEQANQQQQERITANGEGRTPLPPSAGGGGGIAPPSAMTSFMPAGREDILNRSSAGAKQMLPAATDEHLTPRGQGQQQQNGTRSSASGIQRPSNQTETSFGRKGTDEQIHTPAAANWSQARPAEHQTTVGGRAGPTGINQSSPPNAQLPVANSSSFFDAKSSQQQHGRQQQEFQREKLPKTLQQPSSVEQHLAQPGLANLSQTSKGESAGTNQWVGGGGTTIQQQQQKGKETNLSQWTTVSQKGRGPARAGNGTGGVGQRAREQEQEKGELRPAEGRMVANGSEATSQGRGGQGGGGGGGPTVTAGGGSTSKGEEKGRPDEVEGRKTGQEKGGTEQGGRPTGREEKEEANGGITTGHDGEGKGGGGGGEGRGNQVQKGREGKEGEGRRAEDERTRTAGTGTGAARGGKTTAFPGTTVATGTAPGNGTGTQGQQTQSATQLPAQQQQTTTTQDPKIRKELERAGAPEVLKHLVPPKPIPLPEPAKAVIESQCAGGKCLTQKREFLEQRAVVANQEQAVEQKLNPGKSVVQVKQEVESRLTRTFELKRALLKSAGLEGKVEPVNNGVFQGDMLLTEEQARQLIAELTRQAATQRAAQSRTRRAGNALFMEQSPSQRWPLNAPIQFLFDRSLAERERTAVRQALAEIQSKTCLKFAEVSSKPTGSHLFYTKIANPTFCGLSYIGRIEPANPIYLSFACGNEAGVAMHETLHALGFQHEQLRYDRDNFISIQWENVNPQQFDFFAVSDVTKFSSYGLRYDYGSIMHYSSSIAAQSPGKKTMTAKLAPAFNDPLMGQRKGMSVSDAEALKRMYCQPNCEDKLVYCGIWATLNLCNPQMWRRAVTHQWIVSNCQKSCNVCGQTFEAPAKQPF